ncbi:MAG: ELM1/GtrOC1 family putative glycosyltransferase [Candidatus Omnitrophota bacterium]|nr:ELM1/GtrOC1 family putative glycosyltransferase [Candidatus Omnitrophota bacterium]
MLDLIASYLVRGISLFLHVMPIQFNLLLGRLLGTFIYFLSGKRGRIAYANLKAAFCEEKTPRELKRITKGVYRHVAQTFAEMISMTKVDKKYIEKYVRIQNLERVEKASKNPKGMILVSAHFGNWELSTMASAFKGFPLNMLAREQSMERLDELLNRLRESKGNAVIRKGTDIKNIFRVLKRGEGVGLLADQSAGAGGELVDLFGRPASTTVGPYRIAQKIGSCILPAFIHRKKGPYHELVLEPLMTIEKKADLIPYVREYNRLLEKHIRDYPDQWFWMHKKWKLTPVRKVMILDDGKKGHLKQSLAVVKQFRRYREDEGFKPEDTVVDIVSIRFRNGIAKGMFNFLAPFVASHLQGRLGCLRTVLDRESYENITRKYADIIVSCGSALSGMNLAMKAENNARNLAVFDPGALKRGKFDLLVVPRHDLAGKKKKAIDEDKFIVTELAPNLIFPDELVSFKEGMKIEGGVRVGLLLGGDNPGFTFGKGLLESLEKSLREVCEKMDGRLYMTTSRRTSDLAESIMGGAFKGYPGCRMFVSGRDDRSEHTVEKILAASDVVIVSGESISMVSEAVSSGKPVLVFMPDKKTGRARKYEKFTDNLRQRKYLRVVRPEDIPGEVKSVLEKGTGLVVPDDDRRIYEKMYKLF